MVLQTAKVSIISETGKFLPDFLQKRAQRGDSPLGSTFTHKAMLHTLLAEYHIPVLCGFPGGHGDVNLPLVMGAPVTIDVRSDGATLQFNIEGTQQEVQTAGIEAPSTPAAVRMRLAGKRE